MVSMRQHASACIDRLLHPVNAPITADRDQSPQSPQVHNGALWCIMVHYGTFRCMMVHDGALWCIMMHYGACMLIQC